MEKRDILKMIEPKGFNKTLWNKAGKAMHRFGMIKEGDRIAVGVSGGKDSLTLLNLLTRVKLICGFEFELFPVLINHTENIRCGTEHITEYVKTLGYDLHMVTSNIEKIVFDEKKEKNPCALCSRFRRGLLYRYMTENNITKLALGHHLDDIIETFLMNLFYQGSMKQMRAMYTSEEYGFEIIRPLAFVEEDTIVKYVRKMGLPLLGCECKLYEVKDDPKRLETKILIRNLSKKNPNIRKSIEHALFKEE